MMSKSFLSFAATTGGLGQMFRNKKPGWNGPREVQAECAGVARAELRLSRHKKIWANTPDASKMTRQRRRWLERKGFA